MRKFCLSAVFFVLFAVCAGAEEEKGVKPFVVRTGDCFNSFQLEDDNIYASRDYPCRIVEIVPVDSETVKMVYAISLNKAGAVEYETYYLKKGWRVGFAFNYGTFLIAGTLIGADYNCFILAGLEMKK